MLRVSLPVEFVVLNDWVTHTKLVPAGGMRLLQRAKGYDCTIESGKVTFSQGETTGERPGKLARGSQAAPCDTLVDCNCRGRCLVHNSMLVPIVIQLHQPSGRC